MRQKSVTEEPTNEINGTLRAKINFSTEFSNGIFHVLYFHVPLVVVRLITTFHKNLQGGGVIIGRL